MSIARCLTVLLVAASIGGCASIGTANGRGAEATGFAGADEELALLRLADKVEAAALERR